jgi:NAD(P)H-quinone oxidoreductase subunit 5
MDAVAALALTGTALPAALLALLGAPLLVGRRLPERPVGIATGLLTALAAFAFASALGIALAGRVPQTVVSLGDWFAAGQSVFAIDLLLDPMSLAFALATTLIGGVVAAFSNRYLHREPGYERYFLLYAVFLTGMVLVVVAGSIEVLFAGWELIGLSSALLVGFFHERPAPVRNALRVLVVYRMSDAAMLGAAILVHHLKGRSSLALLFSRRDVAGGNVIGAGEATAIGLLLAAAVAGKCAQLPFSAWLPRAMEGPTPSSAVYYGALSVHAGAYLLLRAAPILERSSLVCVLVGVMGATTALYAGFARRVQTDVKSSLAFGSLLHVSLILVEISLGLYRLAFLHMLGNASMRLFQFLRAPSVLHDFHEARNALGRPKEQRRQADRVLAGPWRLWLYRFGLERGHVEDLVDCAVVAPVVRLTRALDEGEKRFADLIAGRGSHE